MPRAGQYRHWVTWQTLAPVALAVSSLTQVGGVATVTTALPHQFSADDRVTIAGAHQAAYNGTVVVTVTGATTFTYPVAGDPATPATGTITAAYVSDRLRGERRKWRDLVQTFGSWRALTVRDRESLQGAQMTSPVTHAITVRWRADLAHGSTLRAIVDSVPYEVESVLNLDGRRRELMALCLTRQEQA